MLGPYAVLPGGKDAVWIGGFLRRLVEAYQCMIVEGVRVHDRVIIRGRSAVFSPAMFGRQLNQLHESRPIFLVRLDVPRDRNSKNEDESALPVARRKAEREDRQDVVLGGF